MKMKKLKFAGALTAVATAAGGGVLLLSPAPPASAAVILDQCPTLSVGYHGGCIDELQIELNEYDNAGLAVDGTFGPTVVTAVKAFQSQHGVPVDGTVGPATKAALDGEGSVSTPVPGAAGPAPAPADTESPPLCLASTTSQCVPAGPHDSGEADFPTKELIEGHERAVEGQTFPMPGRLVDPDVIPIIP